ncbi:LysR substrate-binding domain-containing protein [Shewanella sp. NIFS-20-20]|uniref:LysR substrate-binding domain-containing protein n=1 Tax=Shewanella sp. NIFS-20-20 TaxID=2853806 RepID=UPI001C44725F|nr:hypothetical protein [Shewanella sp. NIFS-20-20]
METQVQLIDYAREGIDIGLRYGQGQWPGLAAEYLMAETVFPVCAPALVAQGLQRIEHLSQYPLLHDTSVANNPNYPSWSCWFRQQHRPLPNNVGLQINSSADLIAAAIRAQEVALGREVLVRDDIASGTLVCPFGSAAAITSAMAYHVVWQQDRPCNQAMIDFRHWLQQQAAAPVTQQAAPA